MTKRLNHLQFKIFAFAHRHKVLPLAFILHLRVNAKGFVRVFVFLLFTSAFIAKSLAIPVIFYFLGLRVTQNIFGIACVVFAVFLLVGVSETDW